MPFRCIYQKPECEPIRQMACDVGRDWRAQAPSSLCHSLAASTVKYRPIESPSHVYICNGEFRHEKLWG